MKQKRRGGTKFGQHGPSPAKVEADRLRAVASAHIAFACAACPYIAPEDARCAWMCAIAREVGVRDPRA
jgi:hypothetical protein